MPEKKLIALPSREENIAWSWAIVIAFSVPELGALMRALRLCFFKKVKSFGWRDFGIVFVIETFYVIGMSLLAFVVLPELDALQGAMVMNCLCLVPGVLCEF